MFLITDNLVKSESKYEIMKEEKCDLTKEEEANLSKEDRFEYITNQRSKTCRALYIVLIGIAFTAAMWITLLPKYHEHHQQSTLNPYILGNIHNATTESDVILNKVKDSVAIISEYNVKKASEYVTAVQDMLQDRTKYAITKINQIIMDKIREIENELTSFGYVITDASDGILDYTLQDLRHLRESMSSTSNDTYKKDFEKVYTGVSDKITSAFNDLDSMYTFYGSYLSDIIEHKVQNATDRISMIVNSNRKNCECTIKEKINLCYTIASQNLQISKQMEQIVKVLGIIYNTTDIIDTLEPAVLETADKQTCGQLSEARETLNKAMARAEGTLQTILEDDKCFLGTAVRKEAYKTHGNLKNVILNGFETSIQSLGKSLNDTTNGFKVVQEKHWTEVKKSLDEALKAIGDEIRSQMGKLYKPEDEYANRANFAELDTWMDTKFHNVTEVINPMFESRQQFIAESLKYTLQFIVFQQVPFISSLSVQNYLPMDVCPLSTDYQRFISITLDPFGKDNVNDKLTTTAEYMEKKVPDEVVDQQDDAEQTTGNIILIPLQPSTPPQDEQGNTFNEEKDSINQMIDNIVANLLVNDGDNSDQTMQITVTQVETVQEDPQNEK